MCDYFPEDPQNSDGVRRILSLDWISRKEVRWPLVPYSLIDSRFKTHNRHLQTLDLCFDPEYYQWTQQHIPDESTIIHKIYESYPPLKVILSKYHGKVALCGGLLCRTVLSDDYPRDCDLFFYGPSAPSAAALAEYRHILEDCVAIIASLASHSTVSRNDHVVNVLARNSDGTDSKYQFIQRLYPRLDMILGGFDIGPSMIGFDGVQVVTTQLGGWSLVKRAVIVDTTRRSISFEHRLEKYKEMGFGVVLPGLDFSVLSSQLESEQEEDRFTLNERFAVSVVHSNPYCVLLEKRIPRRNENVPLEPLKERIVRYSDYMVFDPCPVMMDDDMEIIYKFNASVLKIGARERLIVCSNLPRDYKEAKEIFSGLIDNPKILLGESFAEQHARWLEEGLPEFNNDNQFNYSATHYRKFCEFFEEYKQLLGSFLIGKLDNEIFDARDKIPQSEQYCEFIRRASDVLTRRVVERSKIWMEEFKGLKWRTDNPGAQHTASINPVIEDPRKFYINCYRPFIVGIPKDVEYCVWVLFHGQLKFPRETVQLLLRHLVKSAQQCTKFYLLSGSDEKDVNLKRKLESNTESQKRRKLDG